LSFTATVQGKKKSVKVKESNTVDNPGSESVKTELKIKVMKSKKSKK
jgi:hypothetical protein